MSAVTTAPPSPSTTIATLAARSFDGFTFTPDLSIPTGPFYTEPTGGYYTPPIRTDCVTATPNPSNGNVPPGSCNALWNYSPSFAAAVAFSLLFGGLIIVHAAQAFVFKKRWAWVIIMGCAWELASFASRAFGARDQQNSAAVTMVQLFILLAPLWVNAFVYMVFGRMVHFLVPSKALYGVRATLIARVFVGLDVVSFVVQMVGGFMASGVDVPPKQLRTGLDIYMTGIGIQLFFIVVFAGLVVRFWMEVSKAGRQGLLISLHTSRWKQLTIALYVALALISARIIFRLVEFSSGTSADNPLLSQEKWIYIFDATPIFLCALVLSILHPGRVLSGAESEFPSFSRTEKKQIKHIVKTAKEEAKARGLRWVERFQIGRSVRRNEAQRILIERESHLPVGTSFGMK